MRDSLIDEVMTDIRNAEERSDGIIKDAQQRGKDIVLVAQADADRRRAEAKAACKELRRQTAAEADRLAAEKRKAILKKGADDAKDLIDNKNSAVEEAADRVVDMFFERLK